MGNFKIAISSEQKDKEFLKHLVYVEAIAGAVDFVRKWRKCQDIASMYVVTNSNRHAAEALDCICLENILPLTAS